MAGQRDGVALHVDEVRPPRDAVAHHRVGDEEVTARERRRQGGVEHEPLARVDAELADLVGRQVVVEDGADLVQPGDVGAQRARGADVDDLDLVASRVLGERPGHLDGGEGLADAGEHDGHPRRDVGRLGGDGCDDEDLHGLHAIAVGART